MIKNTALVVFLSLISGIASAQTMKNLSVNSNNVAVNSDVIFTLEVDKNMQDKLLCGLVMDYGNGEVKEYVAGLNGNADQKMAITYQFKKAGTYQVSADGKLPITDLGLLAKAMAVPPMCWGGKKTVTVTVVEAAPKPVDVAPAAEAPKPKVAAPAQPKAETPKPAAPAPKPAVDTAPKAPAKAKAESIL